MNLREQTFTIAREHAYTNAEHSILESALEALVASRRWFWISLVLGSALCLSACQPSTPFDPQSSFDPFGSRVGWLIADPTSFHGYFASVPEGAHVDRTDRREGACVVTRWTEGESSPRAVLAGTVSARGGGSCDAEPNEDSSYDCSLDRDHALWDLETGGAVTLVASGGEIPPFTITLEGPVEPEGMRVPERASAADDLEVTWTGETADVYAVWGATTAMNASGEYLGIFVMCGAAAESGRLVIPRGVLQEMRAYDQDGLGIGARLGFTAEHREVVDVGGFEILAAARLFVGSTGLEP